MSLTDSVRRTAAIYVRISADREGRELGVERQEEDCRKLAASRNLIVSEVFSDNDISASRRSKKPRPDYARMLDEVRAGRIGTILAYSTSRLTRRPREMEDLIDLVEHHGLDIHTVVSGRVDLSTAAGRTVAGILAYVDAGEADTMSERHRRERQQRREQGRWHGGFRPFGFDRNGRTPRPDEQKLIIAGCSAILDGKSLASVARQWSAVMPPPTWHAPLVAKWSTSTVRDVLRNPRIAGMLPSERPSVEWSPIVDEATWRGVSAILSNPGRRTGGGRGPSRLLTAIARCGLCGAPINGGVSRYGHTYRCSAAKHLDRNAAPVDEFVTEVALTYLAEQKVTAATDDAGPSRGELARQAAGIRAQLDEAYAEAARPGGLSARALTAIERPLQAALDEAEGRLAAAAGTSALRGLPLSDEALRAWWADADVDRRRAVLRALPWVVRVEPPGRGAHVFRPESVRIEWR